MPFIREEHPYLPVILLTGMDTDDIAEAQEFPCTYFVPKPVSKEHLIRMVLFYMGKSKKSGQYIENLEDEKKGLEDYQALLEEELESLQEAEAEAAQEDKATAKRSKREHKSFQKTQELLESLLSQSEIMPSFVEDLEDTYKTQFNLFKKVIEVLVRFDVADSSTPGLDIHKHKGTENVYSARLNVKVRLYYYKSPKSAKKKLLRLDTKHATKTIDKWLKNSYATYAD